MWTIQNTQFLRYSWQWLKCLKEYATFITNVSTESKTYIKNSRLFWWKRSRQDTFNRYSNVHMIMIHNILSEVSWNPCWFLKFNCLGVQLYAEQVNFVSGYSCDRQLHSIIWMYSFMPSMSALIKVIRVTDSYLKLLWEIYHVARCSISSKWMNTFDVLSHSNMMACLEEDYLIVA